MHDDKFKLKLDILPLELSSVWSLDGPVRLVGVFPLLLCQSKLSLVSCVKWHVGSGYSSSNVQSANESVNYQKKDSRLTYKDKLCSYCIDIEF